MKYYITNFYNVRFLKENQIPISTAVWQPKWFTLHVDSNNVMNGITEKLLSPWKVPEEHVCSKDCEYRGHPEKCQFLTDYENYLNTLDFNYILSEFNRVAEDVRKITHFVGEPEIVLLVYEKSDNPCSERWKLIKLFSKHGIELTEFHTKEEIEKLEEIRKDMCEHHDEIVQKIKDYRKNNS